MPEISQLEWVFQLSAACSLCSAVAGVGGYLIFRDRHRKSLAREERLRAERIAAEAAILRVKQLEAYTPLFDPQHAPYGPHPVPHAPPAVVFDVNGVPVIAPENVTYRQTTETVVNPPMFTPVPRRAPSPSPLACEADEDTRARWADLVGPDLPAWATTTDMQHLVSGGGEQDAEIRGRHGAFRLATA
jgi:hypothetical protein